MVAACRMRQAEAKRVRAVWGSAPQISLAQLIAKMARERSGHPKLQSQSTHAELPFAFNRHGCLS